MKRILIIAGVLVAAFAVVLILQKSAFLSPFIWEMTQGGTWLLPLILVAAILDSVHPCSFSILLITIAFLFGMQLDRRRILAVGGVYIAGIFAAYLAIGLGILQALHLFNTPHFMGKLGAMLLVFFGIVNLLNRFFPEFPIKLKLPSAAHESMGKLMYRASMPAAFLLGALVGLCQFPCMGGPYLMVIGLLRDSMTYWQGFGYLVLYNSLLIVPLVVVLWFSADRGVLAKVEAWKDTNIDGVRLWSGLAMIALGLLIYLM